MFGGQARRLGGLAERCREALATEPRRAAGQFTPSVAAFQPLVRSPTFDGARQRDPRRRHYGGVPCGRHEAESEEVPQHPGVVGTDRSLDAGAAQGTSQGRTEQVRCNARLAADRLLRTTLLET